MSTETMGFPGEITREVNEIRDTLLGEHNERIQELESDVAFLARFVQVAQAGHATLEDYERIRKIGGSEMHEKEMEEVVRAQLAASENAPTSENAGDPHPQDRSRKTAEQRVQARLCQVVWEARGFFSEDEIHQQVDMTLASVRKDRL